MELEFFMHLPTVFQSPKSDTARIQSYPSVYLRYKKNQKITEAYDYKKAGFRITPQNLYYVVKFFNTAIEWFYLDEYKDLFLTDEDGNLIFNADYGKLSAITPRGMYDQDVMQINPSVIRFGETAYEGAHLFINTSQYCIPLTYRELGTIFEILKNLSFVNEMTCLIEAYQLALEHQRYGKVNTKPTPFD